ncbi:MAG: serine/threonine-protein kinase [Sandaracinaceae bacterium]
MRSRDDSSGVDEEGRALLQQRVARFWTIMTVLSLVSLALSMLGWLAELQAGLGGAGIFTEPGWDLVFVAVDCGQAAVLAWVCRRGTRSVRFSRLAETGGLIVSISLSSVMGRYSAASFVAHGGFEGAAAELADSYTSMMILAGQLMLLAVRAAIVPTQPKRTLLLTSGLGIPILLAPLLLSVGPNGLVIRALSELRPGMGATHLIFWGFAVTICTVISWVIYGLQREVRAAQRLGQYVLEGKLGAGGMGEVYRARHGLMRRPTAIKLVRAEETGERGLKRFEREVQLSARLTHPNTITLFDYGRTVDGVFYYAMELLDGCTLAEAVDVAGPMPASRVAHVLRHACGALREAHGIGLIHRDIKPENLMLSTQGGERDVVKLLDFGLVKELRVEGDAELTGANSIAGTPRYLAPESIRDPDSVDARTDLYSLGAVAYFMLTGTHVFEAETVVELCAAHLKERPEPPSSRASDVPADLEALVLRCLAKAPADRPESAEALRRELDACALPAWTPRDADGWWREFGADLDSRDAAPGSGRTLAIDRSPR